MLGSLVRDQRSHNWFTWNKVVVLVILAMVINVALGYNLASKGWYLEPPLFTFTPFFYLFSWIPVFVICTLLRPSGNRRILIFLPIVIILVSCWGCYGYGVLLRLDFALAHPMCYPESSPNTKILYNCEIPGGPEAGLGSKSTFLLRGVGTGPLVKITDEKWCTAEGSCKPIAVLQCLAGISSSCEELTRHR